MSKDNIVRKALVDNNEFLAVLLSNTPSHLISLQREINNHINIGKKALGETK